MKSLVKLLTTSMLVVSISGLSIMSTTPDAEAGQDPDFYHSVPMYWVFACEEGQWCIEQVGEARFYPFGEHLYACDTYPDGALVAADADWDGGYGYVPDNGGFFDWGCEEINLDIKEGKDVKVCGYWYNPVGEEPVKECEHFKA